MILIMAEIWKKRIAMMMSPVNFRISSILLGDLLTIISYII